MPPRWTRTWVWASIVLQFLGYVFDVVWHGLLNPGRDPTTVSEMVRHLGTVHLPLYVGAASVLVSTCTALVGEIRQSRTRPAVVLAVVGAIVSAGAEAWHAASHLRLDTHTAPMAGILSAVGFLIVVGAMTWATRRRPRGHGARHERRVA